MQQKRPAVNARDFISDTTRSQLWIGDSHASFIGADCLTLWRGSTIDGHGRVYWLGPQLAYTFSYRRIGRIERRLVALSHLNHLVAVMGEIDVRVHLGGDPKKRKPAWVESYVSNLTRLCDLMGINRLTILGPIPQTTASSNSVDFPQVGSLESRVEASLWLQESLSSMADSFVSVINPMALVGDSRGVMRPDFYLDGCHLNPRGSQILRTHVL